MMPELVGSERCVDELLVSKRSYDIIERQVSYFVCKNTVNGVKKICTPNFREQGAGPMAAADKEDI